ncbi:hypothetical protein SEA_SOYO_39 [Mycobacterium phage SoYo]|uniref:Uncharacterized protein n=35 Tax=Microwolfvirus TaxID=2942894 RepID=A0A0A7S2L5_9CAUD|nr:hypothetical protein M611_gp57 [Mycobacterium phage Jobu08]YP_009195137.1 hypothetical protein AVT20_gp60 [Mycobacterium phage Tiffany]YP_009198464.1 hypothetical protein AVV34_gp61 [Mycobacterium phage MarQuardt]YP_009219100.1 hypothetical protein AVV42_gp64 [Mycobacterium phage Anubis]YP_009635629.1 hypothetical protein FGG58_gp56 [Mycobacterium phage JHC117]YP_009635714.1 hypothetical protein FGG61_gp56 [Mycobacterium phage Microwolf]YP_010060079.1 hypothetical protein KIJ58_gp62 [Mycob
MKISGLILELQKALTNLGDLPLEDDIELLFSLQRGTLSVRIH